MRYIDAAYIIALSAMALYSVSLLWRHRRLERAAARIEADDQVPEALRMPVRTGRR